MCLAARIRAAASWPAHPALENEHNSGLPPGWPARRLLCAQWNDLRPTTSHAWRERLITIDFADAGAVKEVTVLEQGISVPGP